MLYISSLHYDSSTSIGEEKLHMFDRAFPHSPSTRATARDRGCKSGTGSTTWASHSPSTRATARDRPYYRRASQADLWYSRHPIAPPQGRPQGIAPTIHGPGKPICGIVGAIP